MRTCWRLTALALAAALALPAAAEQSNFRLFVLGGVDSSDPDLSPNLRGLSADESANTGFTAGVGLQARMTDVWSTQVEVLYTERSANLQFVGGGLPPLDAEYQLTYVEVPTTVRATFLKGTFRPFLFGGAVFGILLDANAKASAGGRSGEFDVKDQIDGGNIALTGGLGFDIHAGKLTIRLEGRYLYGLSNIASDVDTWKTRDLQGVVGVGFDL